MLNVFKNDDNTRDFTKENRHFEGTCKNSSTKWKICQLIFLGKFRNPESPPPHRNHEIIAPAMMEGDKFDKYGFPIEPTGSSDYR